MGFINRTIIRNYRMGDLKLQSNDSSNVFLSEEILFQDNNHKSHDYTGSAIWAALWSHEIKQESLKVDLKGDNTVIQGFYEDKVGEVTQYQLTYEIIIYVSYETEVIKP